MYLSTTYQFIQKCPILIINTHTKHVKSYQIVTGLNYGQATNNVNHCIALNEFVTSVHSYVFFIFHLSHGRNATLSAVKEAIIQHHNVNSLLNSASSNDRNKTKHKQPSSNQDRIIFQTYNHSQTNQNEKKDVSSTESNKSIRSIHQLLGLSTEIDTLQSSTFDR